MMEKTILIADDDRAIRTVLRHALSQAGYNVRLASNGTSVMRWVEQGEGDLLITDVMMPNENMFDMLPRVTRIRPDLPVVVISAQSTFKTAMTASELGAYEYLPKPFDLDDVLRVIAHALETRRQAPRDGVPVSDPVAEQAVQTEGLPLVGRSPAMQAIFRTLARASMSDLTVLITGESGTGKEVAARTLHDYGRRRDGPFVTVNLAAIPKDQIEPELFGVERGTYAGGVDRTEGRFGQAEGGTLFLDEIGDMPMEAQTKLLRVLQDGQYMAVGGRNPRIANVRIVAATRHDLPRLIDDGRFREDLYYRINVVPVRLPPLRERPEDVPDLARHFMARAAQEGLAAKTFSKGGMDLLIAHSWPGNVRELENFVRRLCVLHSEEVADDDMVRSALGDAPRGTVSEAEPASRMVGPGPDQDHLSGAVAYHLKRYFARHGEDLPPAGLYERILKEVERPLIELTLSATKGNQLKASYLLGLNRNTLRKKIRDLGIEVVKGVGG